LRESGKNGKLAIFSSEEKRDLVREYVDDHPEASNRARADIPSGKFSQLTKFSSEEKRDLIESGKLSQLTQFSSEEKRCPGFLSRRFAVTQLLDTCRESIKSVAGCCLGTCDSLYVKKKAINVTTTVVFSDDDTPL